MLSAQDRRSLENIFRLFNELEKSSQDGSFAETSLQNLNQLLQKLSESENPDVQKLSSIHLHLHAKMSLKHFVAFLLPIERLLQKNTRDDDFLVSESDKSTKPTQALPLVFVLDNIRSAFNVGSCLRTAECLNIQKVYLCGYTPNPQDNSSVLKTALGTENNVQWESALKTSEIITQLKTQNYQIFALETSQVAQSIYEELPLAKPTALVVGNERFGLGQEVLQLCDSILQIPLRGQKNSLNVGVCLAISAFEWNRQYQLSQVTGPA